MMDCSKHMKENQKPGAKLIKENQRINGSIEHLQNARDLSVYAGFLAGGKIDGINYVPKIFRQPNILEKQNLSLTTQQFMINGFRRLVGNQQINRMLGLLPGCGSQRQGETLSDNNFEDNHSLDNADRLRTFSNGKGGEPNSVQLWTASEHVHIGEQVYTPDVMENHYQRIFGKTGTIKAPLRNHPGITYGQAVMMGDFYASFDDMFNAPKVEIDAILSGEKKEHPIIVGKKSKERTKKDEEFLKGIDEYFGEVTGTRYIDLAKENYAHYSHHERSDISTNIEEWEKYHMEAFEIASNALKNKDKNIAGQEAGRAFMKNAYADHFLSDTFAVGHLTGMSPIYREIWEYIDSILEKSISEVLDELASKYTEIPILVSGPPIAGILIMIQKLGAWGAAKYLSGREDIQKIKYKVIHDLDNLYGRRVRNSLKDEWSAYGDLRLVDDANRENFSRVLKAVEMSKDEIVDAFKGLYPRLLPKNLYPIETASAIPWDREAARKRLKKIISENVGMVSLLWTDDDIVRKYLQSVRDSELIYLANKEKIRMIKILLDKYTGTQDERVIIRILKVTNPEDVDSIVSQIGFDEIADDIHGKEYDLFLRCLTEKYAQLDWKSKALIIQNLCEGWTSEPEEEAIVRLLESSGSDFIKVVGMVGKGDLYSNLTGKEEDVYESLLRKHGLEK